MDVTDVAFFHEDMAAPKTYEQGVRDMLEVACITVCLPCRRGKCDRAFHRKCFDIRRAALERFGVKEEK